MTPCVLKACPETEQRKVEEEESLLSLSSCHSNETGHKSLRRRGSCEWGDVGRVVVVAGAASGCTRFGGELLGECEGSKLGEADGEREGLALGTSDGLAEAMVGSPVGDRVGEAVGELVGLEVGSTSSTTKTPVRLGPKRALEFRRVVEPIFASTLPTPLLLGSRKLRMYSPGSRHFCV